MTYSRTLTPFGRAAQNYYEDRQIMVQIQSFSSPAAFWKAYTPGKYDLIFLDIYMDQDNGMDVAVRIREAGDSCSLIFVTSSDAFAVASYDVQAAYYLLKPLDTAKLMKVLDTIQIKNAQDVRYIEVICDRTPVRVPCKNHIICRYLPQCRPASHGCRGSAHLSYLSEI